MYKNVIFLIFSVFISTTCLKADQSLGYISNSTINIGDVIQSIAAKRFLPENSIAIDREFIHEFNHDSIVKTVVNGWFMHQKGGYWDLSIPPPEISWPPSPIIDPFFISIHFTGSLFPTLFSDQNIEYLKKHAPIGARDLFTLNELQKRDIPSYFSGCLTLTLENNFQERNDIIYLVDLDDECINYIKSKTTSPVVVLTHGRAILQFLSENHRLKYANHLLDLYRRAKCVVTTRLHAAMPCLAFRTPLLMLSSKNGGDEPRFSGLIDHTWNCSRKDLCEGKFDYDFDQPPENPQTHIPIRDNLIRLMTEWVNKNNVTSKEI